MNRPRTTSTRQHHRVAGVMIVIAGLSTLAACSADDSDTNQDPVTPAGSVFGSVAPVDNSVVNGGDSPIGSSDVSVPAGGTPGDTSGTP